jgi:hypothetical protein
MLVVCGTLPSQAAFKTGNDLLQQCKSGDFSDAEYCLGYISAVADTLEKPSQPYLKFRGKEIPLYRACFRLGVTQGQVRDVVVQWLEANPEHRDMEAAQLVSYAITLAFPC